MRAVAVEGLFPPHRPLSDLAKSKLTTRAKFIEQVLTAEERSFPWATALSGASRPRGAVSCWPTRPPTRNIVKHA